MRTQQQYRKRKLSQSSLNGPQRKKARFLSDDWDWQKAKVASSRTGGLLAIENKFYDTSRAGGTISTTGAMTGGEMDPTTINCLSAPAQGDTSSDRNGKQIIANSMSISGIINIPAQTNQTVADTFGPVFLALVLDKQTNGAQLNSEDVYKSTDASSVTVASAYRNLEYTKRFKVLATRTILPRQAGITYDGTNIEQCGQLLPFRMDVKLNLPINFKVGTAAGVAQVIDNSLHLIAFSTTSSQGALINYNARMRFRG